ncbi:hypothetical protein THMIRHAS_00710 [Thiosulfatimonas sediminis]|uniref:Alginate export domain-containing protein n=1 Tax=Thiosulfatimonas sediminis TaxID=2675054 RepID=A0A6F8PRP9_9GAMM|nr:hypothetical protein [Thiosulfatimonas sediminis]BBP44698.1 hypothetical protein THMIRHAS_00710 [Thiosulfatimonas sediminis]
MDYQLSGIRSSNLNASQLNQSNPDRFALLRLSQTLADSSTDFSQQRIDRLNATFRHRNDTITFGRQALSWGNGLVFNPLDRINPFAPNQIDKSYKPGVDMLSGQKSLRNDDQLSWFILPKRATFNEKVTYDASSFGIKWYHFSPNSNRDFQWLLLKDEQEQLFGWQLTENSDYGLWNLDLLWSYDQTYRKNTLSALLNWQNSLSIFDRQTVLFGELFYNGYGSALTHTMADNLPSRLVDLQAAGKLFSTHRYYSAIGASAEIYPLLNINATLISNWQDKSQLLALELIYSVSDNDQWLLSWQQPFGQRGSEFMGLQSATSPNRQNNSGSVALQWQHYFSY